MVVGAITEIQDEYVGPLYCLAEIYECCPLVTVSMPTGQTVTLSARHG